MPEGWRRTHTEATPMELYSAGFPKLLREFKGNTKWNLRESLQVERQSCLLLQLYNKIKFFRPLPPDFSTEIMNKLMCEIAQAFPCDCSSLQNRYGFV